MTNATRSLSLSSLSLSALLLAAGAFATGCSSSDASSDAAPDGQNGGVVQIQGAVESKDFCSYADQIQCEAAVKCCTGGAKPFASVDECKQKSTCSQQMGALLSGSQVASGAVSYDANAAGDYLRALSASVSQCGAPASAAKPSFWVGTKGEGEDCTPAGGADQGALLTCKPGLECVITSDGDTVSTKGTCKAVEASSSGGPGAACQSDEDCNGGECKDGKCASDAPGFCQAAPDKPTPSNATPAKMYVSVANVSGGGTSADVTLTYANGGTFYRCTISGGLAQGDKKTCTISQTGNVVDSSGNKDTKEYFFAKMSGNDGLRIATICAYDSNDSAVSCAGTFFDPGGKSDWSAGCGLKDIFAGGYWCSGIWLDGDDHGKCSNVQIDSYDDNYTICNP